MKIAVIAANGHLGHMIVEEALEHKHDVTAIVRNENRSKAQKVILKSIMDITKEDLKGFDVVINAYGQKDESKLDEFKLSVAHLCNCLSETQTKFYIVGGAGSLFINKEHTQQLYQSETFPDYIKPTAQAASDALKYLRHRDDVNWVYISPAINFKYSGEKLKTYIIAGEELTYNSHGESMISYADYAYALMDILQANKFNKQRISLLQR